MNRIFDKLFFITILLLSALPIQADNFSRGKTSKLCYSCHPDMKVTFSESNRLHPPVAKGDCTSCHSPHASQNSYMLRDKDAKLCYKCHSRFENETLKTFVHTPFAKGKCTECHDPHASNFGTMLKKDPDQLCFGCHPDIKSAVETKSSIHPPVSAGECVVCHSPHSSDNKANLLETPDRLCLNCHGGRKQNLSKIHLGYPVAGQNCIICHDAHATNNDHILLPDAHVPMQSMMCDFCHTGPSNAEPFGLVKTAGELCGDCHGDTISAFKAKKNIHVPVQGGMCISCHTPHATKEEKLQLGKQKEYCLKCHTEIKAAIENKDNYIHDALVKGECTDCHDPHSSDSDKLLKSKDASKVCYKCHTQMEKHTHPVGPNYLDPRTNESLTCISCHDPHASKYEYVLHKDKNRELCVQCHDF